MPISRKQFSRNQFTKFVQLPGQTFTLMKIDRYDPCYHWPWSILLVQLIQWLHNFAYPVNLIIHLTIMDASTTNPDKRPRGPDEQNVTDSIQEASTTSQVKTPSRTWRSRRYWVQSFHSNSSTLSSHRCFRHFWAHEGNYSTSTACYGTSPTNFTFTERSTPGFIHSWTALVLLLCRPDHAQPLNPLHCTF